MAILCFDFGQIIYDSSTVLSVTTFEAGAFQGGLGTEADMFKAARWVLL